MTIRQRLTWRERTARFLWKVLIWGVGLVPFFTTLFWPRSFDLSTYVLSLQNEFGNARIIARSATFAILILAGGTLLAGLYFHRSGLPRRLWVVLLGVFLLALGPLLSSFLGTSPQFSASHLATPMVLAAVTFLPSVHVTWFIWEIKRLTLFYTVGSLVAAVLVPSWALEIPYKGYIPGFEVRLHGITVHANHTAPFALLFLLLEAAFPSRSILRWFGLGASTLALILTQSKTTWALLIMGLGLMYLFKLIQRPTLNRVANVLLLTLVLTSLLAAVAGEANLQETLTAWVQEQESNIITLTGRTSIWRVVLELVRENPWFGYGPHLWDPEMALAYAPLLGWTPAQSHNQYIQSLGEGGIIGLIGFMAYGLIVLRTGWRYRFVGSGLPFALPLLWFIRGFTESWYRGTTTDGNLTIHMLIFAFLVLLVKNGGRE